GCGYLERGVWLPGLLVEVPEGVHAARPGREPRRHRVVAVHAQPFERLVHGPGVAGLRCGGLLTSRLGLGPGGVAACLPRGGLVLESEHLRSLLSAGSGACFWLAGLPGGGRRRSWCSCSRLSITARIGWPGIHTLAR